MDFENFDLTLVLIGLTVAMAGVGAYFGVDPEQMGVTTVITGLLALAGRYSPKA